MFLIVCIAAIVGLWAYVLLIRPVLARAFPKTWEWLDKTEAYLFDRSRNVLMARGYWVGSIVIGVHEAAAAAGVDWTPILTELSHYLPPQYQTLTLVSFLFLTGIGFEYLRRSHNHESTAEATR